MFGFECSSDDDWDDYDFGVSVRQEKFNPTTVQTKAFEKLAKLKEKFPSYNKPRRLSEVDSYMLRMADMDAAYMEGCDTAFESNMWGDFNGNESDFHSW